MSCFNTLTLILCTFCFLRSADSSECSGDAPPRVLLSTGCVEGTVKESISGRPIYSFLGIPYAAPPVGYLRFRAPQPPVPWSGVLSAVQDPPACNQPLVSQNDFDTYQSEDCLKVLVHTPFLKPPRGKLLPVMVYVHGGGFYLLSSTSKTYGPEFLLTKDIVLVLMNYRLGVFGYLNMNISEAQGNAGLKDKVEALRWIQKEITKFGGDPKSVTLAGDSSGAQEVSLLYISPLTKGLFHRAIAASGGALCFSSFIPSTIEYAMTLASSLNCPTHSHRAVVTCLRDIDSLVLAQGQQILIDKIQKIALPFLPTLEFDWGEEILLPDTPDRLIAQCEDRGPLIASITSGEGLEEANKHKNDIPEQIGLFEKNISSLLPYFMLQTSPERLQEASRRIQSFYLDNCGLGNTSNPFEAYVRFSGDVKFAMCSLETAIQYSIFTTVYLYYFKFIGESQRFDENIHSSIVSKYGACHGCELSYLFKGYTTLQNETDYPGETAMIHTMVTLWTNFIIYGNPTPSHNEWNITWIPMEDGFTRHLDIDEHLEMDDHPLLPDRLEFWDQIYSLLFDMNPKYSNNDFIIMFSICCIIFISLVVCIVLFIFRWQDKKYISI